MTKQTEQQGAAKNPAKRADLSESTIYADMVYDNNRRLFFVFVTIVVLANIAVTAIKAAGIGSQYLEYIHIAYEIAIVTVILSIAYILSRVLKGRIVSAYIMITCVVTSVCVFEYTFHGANQLFAVRYIPLALSVFYFNTGVSIFTVVLAIISQAIIFYIRPELRLPPPYSNTAVRFICYLMVGIGAIFGSRATLRLLKFAIYQHDEAKASLTNLRSIAAAVMNSIQILKKEATDHETITRDMNDISQHQAASLEEITSALEELASNSSAISDIARSLYEELAITVNAVNDLKTVNDKVQDSSAAMEQSLNEVTQYSSSTTEQISRTEKMFNTVKEKSNEMANFVQIINDIADKVNLLSLNAAIEAARAGEYGRGFAVVADEISKLADATTQNAKEIENIIRENIKLIGESGSLIMESVETMNKLNAAIKTIQTEIKEVGNLIGDIGLTIKTIRNLNLKIHESGKTIENSTAEQKIATDESTKLSFDIAHKSQEIVKLATQISHSTQTISELAAELERAVSGMVI